MAVDMPGQHFVVVLDNAPWHQKAFRLIVKERLPEYEDIRNAVTLELLPTYSPDLNPIEQCWRIVRREVTHNRYFKTINELKSKLDAFFGRHDCANRQLQQLCLFHWLKDWSTDYLCI